MYWNTPKNIAFRFLFAYLSLFMLSNQFVTTFFVDPVWKKIVPWVATKILNLPPITIFTNGSGDTTYNYLSLLCYAFVALNITIVWSILDRHRPNYQTLLQWLVVFIRYYLVFQMLLYGFAKLFYSQFPFPSLDKLTQPYGEASPMGLLWTFMGYSHGYNIFTGAAEALGGFLLLFRRTTTLGALVSFGVMVNIMALNYFYDVPVKILSTHIVFLTLFLIFLDSRRLLNVFLLNKATPAKLPVVLIADIGVVRVKNIFKGVLITLGLGALIVFTTRMIKQHGWKAASPPLYGIYEVTSFVKNGEKLPPLTTDTIRWKRLILDRRDRAVIHGMEGQKKRLQYTADTLQQYLTLKLGKDSNSVDTFYYDQLGPERFALEGYHQGDSLKIIFKPKKKEAFLLVKRKFRWINEFPFNR